MASSKEPSIESFHKEHSIVHLEDSKHSGNHVGSYPSFNQRGHDDDELSSNGRHKDSGPTTTLESNHFN
jgi:hypothetical protein